MRRLTASDRSALIKLASGLPVGSSERKAILAGLRTSNHKILKALSAAFMATVKVDDVKYIIYRPVIQGGALTKIQLMDREEHLGHQDVYFLPQEANAQGTTLDEVVSFLSANGARLMKRTPSRPKAIFAGLHRVSSDDVLGRLEAVIKERIVPGRNSIRGYPVDIPDQEGGDLLYFYPVDSDAAKNLIDELRRLKFKVRFDKSDRSIVLT